MTTIPAESIPSLVRRGVPERTARACLNANDTEAIRTLADAKESLVVLAGPAGVGKSVAALLWLFDRAKGKPECLKWVQSGDLARGYAYDQDSFDAVTGVYALVIDDMGVEYVDEKGRWSVTLEEVLSRRFARMRKTVVTTNVVEVEAFKARYGERIASRLNEDGAFVVCGGPDLRRTKGAQ